MDACAINCSNPIARNRQDFVYVEDGRTSANNAGVQVDAGDLGGPNSSGAIVLASTTWSYYPAPYNALYQVFITVNTNGSIPWTTSGQPSSSELDMISAIMHELGHGLGLNHPVRGPNANAVMECFLGYGESVRSQADDQNGEFWLYSGHPSDFGSPGNVPC
jgi:hypothetical protein